MFIDAPLIISKYTTIWKTVFFNEKIKGIKQMPAQPTPISSPTSIPKESPPPGINSITYCPTRKLDPSGVFSLLCPSVS